MYRDGINKGPSYLFLFQSKTPVRRKRKIINVGSEKSISLEYTYRVDHILTNGTETEVRQDFDGDEESGMTCLDDRTRRTRFESPGRKFVIPSFTN